MRYIKQIFLMIFASMALVACGGDGGTTTTTTGNISAGTNYRATKFPAIVVGSTYATTFALMTTAPSAGVPSGPVTATGISTYVWSTGSGNLQETITITTAGPAAGDAVLTKKYWNADGVNL